MSLAKRLEEQVREGRLNEDLAESILAQREQLWLGRDTSGQMTIWPLVQEVKAKE